MTVERKFKQPPFKLDANSTESLSDQMTNGFRRAILGGYYREGDALPPIRALEKIFGVSLFVPREVLGRLTREGLVNPRPHIGSIVMGRHVQMRLGHVLLVIPDVPGAYYANAFGDVLREHLAAAGYSFTRLTVSHKAGGGYDLAGLDTELNRHIDLVVLLFDAPALARRLSKSGKPFIAVGQDFCRLKHCVGNVFRPRNGAAPEFFRHCRNAGVRSVLLADLDGAGFAVLDVADTLGVRVERMLLSPSGGALRPGDIQQKAFDTFSRLLVCGRRLPDLVFLADDNIVVGVLTAVLANRIDVPGKLRLAIWSHVGGGPVFPVSLTRMEMDPYAQGAAVAEGILQRLRGNAFPSDIVLKPLYRIGDSFR